MPAGTDGHFTFFIVISKPYKNYLNSFSVTLLSSLPLRSNP